MTAILTGLGTATPEHFIEQSDACEMATVLAEATGRQKAAVGTLYRRSGVERRHGVVFKSSTNGVSARQEFFARPDASGDRGPGTAERMGFYADRAADLAVRAAKAALVDAELDPARITHLVSVTCTGFSAPGFDLELIDVLELSPDVRRTQVGFMGCHGALNALRVARAYCEADPAAVVLVCAVELCSLHFQYGANPQAIVSNALFADGAAAAIVTAANAASRGWRLAGEGSTVVPGTADYMSWKIGDNGFEMMLSPQTPRVIAEKLGPWFNRWLARHGEFRERIRGWSIHPGGPRILQACGEALQLSSGELAPSLDVLRDYGNMSSPTVLFILDELRRRGTTGPMAILAFGPGLTIEAALLR